MTGNLQECFINIGSWSPLVPKFVCLLWPALSAATPWHWQEVSRGIRHSISVSLSVWTPGPAACLSPRTRPHGDEQFSRIATPRHQRLGRLLSESSKRSGLRGRSMNLQKYRVRTQWIVDGISSTTWKRFDIDIVIYKVECNLYLREKHWSSVVC